MTMSYPKRGSEKQLQLCVSVSVVFLILGNSLTLFKTTVTYHISEAFTSHQEALSHAPVDENIVLDEVVGVVVVAVGMGQGFRWPF